jgi:4-hydroxybenzoate polyprenyltransferase
MKKNRHFPSPRQIRRGAWAITPLLGIPAFAGWLWWPPLLHFSLGAALALSAALIGEPDEN